MSDGLNFRFPCTQNPTPYSQNKFPAFINSKPKPCGDCNQVVLPELLYRTFATDRGRKLLDHVFEFRVMFRVYGLGLLVCGVWAVVFRVQGFRVVERGF